jgi:FecR protein
LRKTLMKISTWWWNWALIAASLAFIQPTAEVKAQDTQVAQDSQAPQGAQDQGMPGVGDQDPPSRVARLNYMQGSVSFQPGGENDWIDAVLNRPLVTGDNLWADEDSRAEVHMGSTALRLGAKTGITLLEMSDRAAQIRLAQGSLIVKVRHVDDEDSYEVDTPNVAFVVMQPGDYRIDVNADGNRTEVTVWRGRGQVTGGGNSYPVVANQHATFASTSNTADQLEYDLGQIPPDDGFDTWALDRDQVEERSDSANYVSRETTGYEDLDEYGTGLWHMLAAHRPGSGLGAIPFRTLDLGRSLGLDVGGKRTLGIRSIPLWTLGFRRDRMDMGSGTQRCAAGLCSGIGGLGWWRARVPLFCGRRSGMVPAGSGRSISSGLSSEPGLREQRERDQYLGECHEGYELLQRCCNRSQFEQHHLCEPAGERRYYRGFPRHIRERAASRMEYSTGSGERTRGRAGVTDRRG